MQGVCAIAYAPTCPWFTGVPHFFYKQGAPFLKALPWGLHGFCAMDTKWNLEHGVLGLEFVSAHYGVLRSGVNLLSYRVFMFSSSFSYGYVVSFIYFFLWSKGYSGGNLPLPICLYMPSKDRIEFHVLVTELLMLSTCVAVIFHLLCGLSFVLKYQPSNCFSNNRIIYA